MANVMALRSAIVSHTITLRLNGNTYTTRTGLIDFSPAGQPLVTKDRVYKFHKQVQFADEPGAVYDLYVCPHRLPSFMFIGCSFNPEVELFVETNELGDLVAYYTTANKYK